MMDQQLEDLDLITFVLVNLEAGEGSETLEFNNNHQAGRIGSPFNLRLIFQDSSQENTKSRRGRPCAKPPSRETLTRRRNVGGGGWVL